MSGTESQISPYSVGRGREANVTSVGVNEGDMGPIL